MDSERDRGIDDAPPYGDEKIRKFKRLVGFDDLPGSDDPGGVRVDWHKLPTVLAEEVKGLRLDWESMSAFETGIGTAQWTWQRRDRQLHVEVFVSGTGPVAARQRLLEIATDTTTVESHMVPSVEVLGDLSIEHFARTGREMVWVFRNVCVVVENDGNGPNVLSVSRRIQALREAHVVPDVARYVPRVTRIDLTPSPIRVGDTFSVTVHLGAPVRVSEVMIEFHPTDTTDLFDWEENRGLERTFLAREPGRTALEIHVLDRKSLLSPKAGVVIDVLPAP
jgi:hypothetical protein